MYLIAAVVASGEGEPIQTLRGEQSDRRILPPQPPLQTGGLCASEDSDGQTLVPLQSREDQASRRLTLGPGGGKFPSPTRPLQMIFNSQASDGIWTLKLWTKLRGGADNNQTAQQKHAVFWKGSLVNTIEWGEVCLVRHSFYETLSDALRLTFTHRRCVGYIFLWKLFHNRLCKKEQRLPQHP